MRDEHLTLKAAALARTAPNAWNEFLVALGAFVESRKMECVRSELSELARAQGRAQLAVSLFDLLGNAVKDADGIARKLERWST